MFFAKWLAISNVMMTTLATLALSLNLNCQWQDRGDYPKGFYRPAGVQLEISGQALRLTDLGYLSRRYEPCWTGGHKSCYFTLAIDTQKDLEILEQEAARIYVEQINGYSIAHFEMVFSKDYRTMILSGDDGDGTFVHDEQFLCEMKK